MSWFADGGQIRVHRLPQSDGERRQGSRGARYAPILEHLQRQRALPTLTDTGYHFFCSHAMQPSGSREKETSQGSLTCKRVVPPHPKDEENRTTGWVIVQRSL